MDVLSFDSNDRKYLFLAFARAASFVSFSKGSITNSKAVIRGFNAE